MTIPSEGAGAGAGARRPGRTDAVTGGRLVIVGTPIGNLDDISTRAVRALAGADVVCCEDTRRTRRLLGALGVPAPRLVRVDAHTEVASVSSILDWLRRGQTVALVTDGGMPAVSDPGQVVVRAVAGAGLSLEVVPGPSAVSAALALSGFPASRYRFAGFLARSGRQRSDEVSAIAEEKETTVIFESPHRVARTLGDLCAACGAQRPVVLARELTKVHEEVWHGTLGEACDRLSVEADAPRGEWVLVVAGAGEGCLHGSPEKDLPSDELIVEQLRAHLAAGTTKSAAVREVAASMGVPRRRVYGLSLTMARGP